MRAAIACLVIVLSIADRVSTQFRIVGALYTKDGSQSHRQTKDREMPNWEYYLYAPWSVAAVLAKILVPVFFGYPDYRVEHTASD